MPSKILHVITSLGQGGAERLVTDLLLRLKRRGDEVVVFLFDATPTPFLEELKREGVEIVAGGKGYRQRWNPLNYFPLRRLLKNRHFDIIHTHNTPAQVLTMLAARKGEHTKYVTTEHNTSNRRRKWKWGAMADRKLYAFYDRVVCVSPLTLQNLLKHLNGSEASEKFAVIPNGIDIARLKAAKKGHRPEDLEGKVMILMVAAFRKQKDHATLLRALRLLPERFVVWLAGSGAELDKVKQLAETLGVGSRVKFLGNRSDVASLYAMADIVVLSTQYEGLSLSSLEGMASGKPFVASDVEGVRDVAKDAALLFTQGDPKELALKLKEVESDPALRSETAVRCMERVKDFDIEKTFARYCDVYDHD